MSKSKKAKELFSNTLLFAISNFGTKAISFFLVPLYTFVLSTKDYGNIDLVSTTVYLIAPILTLNIQDVVLIFCLDKEYNPLQVLKVGIKMAEYASALLGIGLIIVHNLPFFHLSIMYSVYLYLTFIINAFYNIREINGTYSPVPYIFQCTTVQRYGKYMAYKRDSRFYSVNPDKYAFFLFLA